MSDEYDERTCEGCKHALPYGLCDYPGGGDACGDMWGWEPVERESEERTPPPQEET